MTDEKSKPQEKPTFDANRQIGITLETPDGDKAITVRFPTDAEWIERQRKIKIIFKQLGRSMSETKQPDTREIDAELLKTIRIDIEGPEINEYEAVEVLDVLRQADLDEVIKEGNAFRVTLNVPGLQTTHTVMMPSAQDLFEYRRARASTRDIGNNKQSITINLAASGDLYKKRVKSAEGYTGAVPIIHQSAVIGAIMEEIESRKGSAKSENF